MTVVQMGGLENCFVFLNQKLISCLAWSCLKQKKKKWKHRLKVKNNIYLMYYQMNTARHKY